MGRQWSWFLWFGFYERNEKTLIHKYTCTCVWWKLMLKLFGCRFIRDWSSPELVAFFAFFCDFFTFNFLSQHLCFIYILFCFVSFISFLLKHYIYIIVIIIYKLLVAATFRFIASSSNHCGDEIYIYILVAPSGFRFVYREFFTF